MHQHLVDCSYDRYKKLPHIGISIKIVSTGIIWQEEVRSDPHKDSEQWRVLRPVWRGEVCYPGRTGPVLHGEPGAAEGEEWGGHRTQVSPQLRGPHHGEVGLKTPPPPKKNRTHHWFIIN